MSFVELPKKCVVVRKHIKRHNHKLLWKFNKGHTVGNITTGRPWSIILAILARSLHDYLRRSFFLTSTLSEGNPQAFMLGNSLLVDQTIAMPARWRVFWNILEHKTGHNSNKHDDFLSKECSAVIFSVLTTSNNICVRASAPHVCTFACVYWVSM